MITVLVDAENVAHETKVTVGIRTADKIEIVEGLRGGETVVIEGNYALPDGTKVEPQIDTNNTDKKEAILNQCKSVFIRGPIL